MTEITEVNLNNIGWMVLTELVLIGILLIRDMVKVAFIQKILIHLSFPQTYEPYYFPDLEF